MRRFNIVHKPSGQLLGVLTYFPETETGYIDLLSRHENMGLALRSCWDRGVRHLDNEQVYLWASERVCSSSRPDIRAILDYCGLEHYNELSMTVALKDTVTDYDTLVEIKDVDDSYIVDSGVLKKMKL